MGGWVVEWLSGASGALNLQFQFENNKLSTSIKSCARKARLGSTRPRLGLFCYVLSPCQGSQVCVVLLAAYCYLIYARHDHLSPPRFPPFLFGGWLHYANAIASKTKQNANKKEK